MNRFYVQLDLSKQLKLNSGPYIAFLVGPLREAISINTGKSQEASPPEMARPSGSNPSNLNVGTLTLKQQAALSSLRGASSSKPNTSSNSKISLL